MRRGFFVYQIIFFVATVLLLSCGNNRNAKDWELCTSDGLPVRVLSLDSMDIKNPFIYLDRDALTYYMTGDGGELWISNNLRAWKGPYNALQLDKDTWMGVEPIITAPEIHKYNGKYYYVATFSRPDVVIDNVRGKDIVRESCQLLIADSVCGPYKPLQADAPLLKADRACSGGTFITDEYNTGFLIFNHNWEQGFEGTTEIIMMTENLSEQIGEPYIMFSASQNNWSIGEDSLGQKSWSPVMEGPFLFDTEGMELGILFATEIEGKSALGVAYSEKNHGLNGPWHIEPAPMLTGGYGQAMLFKDFDGTLVMVLHKECVVGGKTKYIPQLIEMDQQFDKLKIKGKYNY